MLKKDIDTSRVYWPKYNPRKKLFPSAPVKKKKKKLVEASNQLL